MASPALSWGAVLLLSMAAALLAPATTGSTTAGSTTTAEPVTSPPADCSELRALAAVRTDRETSLGTSIATLTKLMVDTCCDSCSGCCAALSAAALHGATDTRCKNDLKETISKAKRVLASVKQDLAQTQAALKLKCQVDLTTVTTTPSGGDAALAPLPVNDNANANDDDDANDANDDDLGGAPAADTEPVPWAPRARPRCVSPCQMYCSGCPAASPAIVIPCRQPKGAAPSWAIAKGAFAHCATLVAVVITERARVIETDAFAWSSVRDVTIEGNSLVIIGKGAFRFCRRLRSINIPQGVHTIAPLAFAFGVGLAAIDIPPSVESIASYAFANCAGLASVRWPGGAHGGQVRLRVFWLVATGSAE